MNRVAITGIGLVTALGTGVDETWAGVVEGRSGLARLSAFDPAGLHTQVGAEIPEFDAKPYVANRRALRNMTRNDQLALVGATLAVRDAGLDLTSEDGNNVGLFLGGNKEISHPDRMLDAALAFRGGDGNVDMATVGTEGAKRFYPLFYIEGLQAASLFYISEAFGLRGENTYFAGTADAGATAIARAFRAVRRGEARAAIAGGWDDATSWWHTGKMDALGVLTRSNELGAGACRPFDRNRDGAALGEGSAFVVLEDAAAAADRGARVYAEIVGFGGGFDTHGLVTPSPDGRGLAHALRAALADAALDAEAVDYVAVHGCGTRLGDASEAAAMRSALGAAVGQLAASSVKPATGHLVAGAGALNVAVAALATHHNVVPPTLNLVDVDPSCEGIDWVPGTAREQRVDTSLAIARGLHGQNIVLALQAAA